MMLPRQDHIWLFLTVTATFIVLFALLAYLIMGSLDKQQKNNTPENDLPHRVNQITTTLYSLSTTIKRLQVLNDRLTTSVNNQQESLTTVGKTFTHLAADIKAMSSHYTQLNERINRMLASTTREKLNDETQTIEEAVKAMQKTLHNTTQYSHHQQQNIITDNAIMTFLQTKMATLHQQAAQLRVRLSELNDDAEKISQTKPSPIK